MTFLLSQKVVAYLASVYAMLGSGTTSLVTAVMGSGVCPWGGTAAKAESTPSWLLLCPRGHEFCASGRTVPTSCTWKLKHRQLLVQTNIPRVAWRSLS